MVGFAVPTGKERPFRPAFSVRFIIHFYNNLASFHGFTNIISGKNQPFFYGFAFPTRHFSPCRGRKAEKRFDSDPYACYIILD